MRTLAAWVVLALVIAACGSDPPPSTSTSEAPEPSGPAIAIACWDVGPADCDRVVAEGLARLPPGGPPVAAASVRAAQQELIVEFADGRGLASTPWSLEPGQPIVFGAWDDVPSAAIAPGSPPLLGATTRFSLGHCGLASPIDIDGALWDPVGRIDGTASEAINAADGEFRRTARTTGEFVAATGFRVALRRHEGRKSVMLCD